MLTYLGQVSSAPWTNQGPQQWDQSGPADDRSGQFPYSTIPQDQYTQMDQQGQFQNGTDYLHGVVMPYDHYAY